MVRTLVTLSQTMKSLPGIKQKLTIDTRYLTIKLLYYDNCPSNYQPKWFRETTQSKSRFLII